MAEASGKEKIQNVFLYSRKSGEINGVKEVLSFDENSIILDTECGTLDVEGSDLCVTKLDTDGGVVAFAGDIRGLVYQEAEPERKGLFGSIKRMFD